MPTMQIIKRRISSVSNTRQITEAMNHIAASKFQRSKVQLKTARSLFDGTSRVIDDLRNSEEAINNVFVKPRKVENTAYVVITSDRGMCGAYNANISKETLKHMGPGQNHQIIAVGTKGWEYFRRREKNILRKYSGVTETVFYEDAENIGHFIISLYLSGKIDEAYVAYTAFESTLSHIPRLVKVLPVGGGAEAGRRVSLMKYDPDVNTVLSYLSPLYLNTFIYGAMVEASVCEQAARMVCMDSATNNAGEIIEDLTLAYNRIRQGAITQEITEIVSGASALK